MAIIKKFRIKSFKEKDYQLFMKSMKIRFTNKIGDYFQDCHLWNDKVKYFIEGSKWETLTLERELKIF